MRGLVAVAVALAALGAAPAASHAASVQSDNTFFVVFGGGAASSSAGIDLPVKLSGAVSVDFHGSEAAGCAALGRCALSGTEVFDPGRTGDLLVVPLRLHGKKLVFGFLVLGAEHGVSTTAHTQRAGVSGPVGSCGDVASALGAGQMLGRGLSHSLSIRLGGISPLNGLDTFATRCPGPLGKDLLPLLPSRRLPRAVIKHGGSIDLSTTRPFSTSGFEGIVRSTVLMHIARRRRPSGSSENIVDSSGVGRHRTRAIGVTYRIERVSGSAGFTFAGLGDPAECLQLDACGTSGAVTESLGGASGRLDLVANASARRPRRDLRTLLGLARGGRTERVRAQASGEWRSGTGAVNSSVAWGGGQPCTDTVPLGTGELAGVAAGTRFRLEFGTADSAGDLHTRCAGPLQADLAGTQPLASGSLPLSALRRRIVTIHLTRAPGVVPTSAYSGSFQADITVTLRRIRVREQVFTDSF
jgi:hypothetical protein